MYVYVCMCVCVRACVWVGVFVPTDVLVCTHYVVYLRVLLRNHSVRIERADGSVDHVEGLAIVLSNEDEEYYRRQRSLLLGSAIAIPLGTVLLISLCVYGWKRMQEDEESEVSELAHHLRLRGTV
jgi:hypothetical protein